MRHEDLLFAKTTSWVNGEVEGYTVHTAVPDGILRQVGFVWPQSSRRWQAVRQGEHVAQRGFLSRDDAGFWLCQPIFATGIEGLSPHCRHNPK